MMVLALQLFMDRTEFAGDTLVESTALGSVGAILSGRTGHAACLNCLTTYPGRGSTESTLRGELPLTTLSLEDRQRFGLDVTPPPSEVLMFWKLVMVAMVCLDRLDLLVPIKRMK